jgi:hypothetical protein
MILKPQQTMIILNLIIVDVFFFFFSIPLLLDFNDMKKLTRSLPEQKSSKPSKTKKLLSTIFCSCIPSRQ